MFHEEKCNIGHFLKDCDSMVGGTEPNNHFGRKREVEDLETELTMTLERLQKK